MMKTCTKCGIEKELTEFHREKSHLDGRRGDCKLCNTKRVKAYNRTDSGKEFHRLSAIRERELHPQRYYARIACRNAVRDGKLFRQPCELCKATPEQTKIEGHHYLGYDKEHWLDVQWLCVKCHVFVDSE